MHRTIHVGREHPRVGGGWGGRVSAYTYGKGPFPLESYAIRAEQLLKRCIRFLNASVFWTLLDPAANPVDSVQYDSIGEVRRVVRTRERTVFWLHAVEFELINLNGWRLLRRPSVKRKGVDTWRYRLCGFQPKVHNPNLTLGQWTSLKRA